jgi:hypothetical protein
MLKGRFPMLRGVPNYDLLYACQSIETLMVIHNILVSEGDDPESIDGYSGAEDPAVQAMHAERGENRGELDRQFTPALGHTRGNLSHQESFLLGTARRLTLVQHWNRMN